MAEMTKLRPILKTMLEQSASRVFYERTSGRPVFPYVVFDVSGYSYSEVVDQSEFEVFIYDNDTDTTILETLADTIWKQFDHLYYNDTDMSFAIYQNVRNSIEVDEVLHSRRLLFTIRIC